MSIKKHRLMRALEQGADWETRTRIADALGVSVLSLCKRTTNHQSSINNVYAVNEDGSLNW